MVQTFIDPEYDLLSEDSDIMHGEKFEYFAQKWPHFFRFLVVDFFG